MQGLGKTSYHMYLDIILSTNFTGVGVFSVYYYSFAIPVETLKFVVKKLIIDGRVVRPVLGISFLQSAQARALGVKRGVL